MTLLSVYILLICIIFLVILSLDKKYFFYSQLVVDGEIQFGLI